MSLRTLATIAKPPLLVTFYTMQSPYTPLFTELPRETVWKLLRTGQPPHHQPRHRRVDKGLPRRTQPLVVFGHPPVVGDPREGAFRHPPTRGKTRKPLGGINLCHSTSLPSLAHSRAQILAT